MWHKLFRGVGASENLIPQGIKSEFISNLSKQSAFFKIFERFFNSNCAAFTHAEDSAHARVSVNKRQVAFTLAEVLITLGVIGIVAAMTLPTLIQHRQEKITVNQLKKSYSILQQVYDRIVFETGSEPKDRCMSGMYEENSHIIMANKFAPYLNIAQNCIGKDSAYTQKHCTDSGTANSGVSTSVRLIDGTTMNFRLWNGQSNWVWGTSKPLGAVCGRITVDVNGPKSPNKSGFDQFGFYLTNYGIVPVGTQAESEHAFEKFCNQAVAPWGTDLGGNFSNGYGCTAWVLFNENQDYLHCSDLGWNKKSRCKK